MRRSANAPACGLRRRARAGVRLRLGPRGSLRDDVMLLHPHEGRVDHDEDGDDEEDARR